MLNPTPLSTPRLELIVAVARNGVIGRDNALPWHLPKDLAFFKRVTMGHPILMGRRTWQSIGKALPGRLNLVLTRDASFVAPGASVVHTVEQALHALPTDRVMVIGGAELFAILLPRADTLYLTEVDADVPGNVFFPEWPRAEWREEWRESHPADAEHAYPFSFVRWVKRR
jgi:dihydrofolate reductase